MGHVRDDRADKRHEPGGASAHRSRPVITLALLFLAIVLVVDGVLGEHGWLANRRAQQQYDRALQDLEAIRSSNAGLREEANRLRTDPAAIEEVARRELGLIRPGEKLFIIHDVPQPAK